MSPLYAAVLGVIVVTLLVVSLLRARTVKTKADFLVAGRSLPAFVLVFRSDVAFVCCCSGRDCCHAAGCFAVARAHGQDEGGLPGGRPVPACVRAGVQIGCRLCMLLFWA